eukprot:TRINITY_DN32155_c0_g2_i1.p1 TRINITY_DN32155_c0_g2~~TRINITY_DN32155_c0_g2_i1.p1  ORF type:complete len:106 (-),score=0.89 TRINITY_DN32155_c0_g2_i1:755-1072(-)
MRKIGFVIMEEAREWSSLDPLFRSFVEIKNSQLCRIPCQLMHHLNCFLGMRKSRKTFYTVGYFLLDEIVVSVFMCYNLIGCFHFHHSLISHTLILFNFGIFMHSL